MKKLVISAFALTLTMALMQGCNKESDGEKAVNQAASAAAEGLEKVESGLISGFKYDEGSQTLSIQMKATGETYDYAGVPADVAAGLKSAKSIGEYFNENIKGKFDASKQ